MWPWKRRKGKHRKTERSDLETRLDQVAKDHEQASWQVATKAQRLDTAADRLIAAHAAVLRNSASRGG